MAELAACSTPLPEPTFGDRAHISDEDALRIEMRHIEQIIEWAEAQFAAV
jgi:hypothetical protein